MSAACLLPGLADWSRLGCFSLFSVSSIPESRRKRGRDAKMPVGKVSRTEGVKIFGRNPILGEELLHLPGGHGPVTHGAAELGEVGHGAGRASRGQPLSGLIFGSFSLQDHHLPLNLAELSHPEHVVVLPSWLNAQP